MTVALANDFSWVYTGGSPDPETIAGLARPPPPRRGVTVRIRCQGQPKRVFDAVSGKTLPADVEPQGLSVEVPDFAFLSVVVVEF